MEHLSLNLLGQNRHKKVIERLQADGVETVHDLLEAKDIMEGRAEHNNNINMDYLFRLRSEVGGEEWDALIDNAKKYSQEYNLNFSSLFENQSNIKPKKRECIPLVMPNDSLLFEQENIAVLNKLVGLGEVTQIYGMPGTGKTYFCHHLAANALVDENLRNYNPEVLYIDCDGGFDISIYQNIVDTLLKNSPKLNKKEGLMGTTGEAIKAKFFERLHYKRILDQLDLIELLQKLPELLKQRKNIKLVIFDAFTTHLRIIHDQKSVNKIINEYSVKILQIAKNCHVSIIIVNLLLYLQNKKELYGDILGPNIHNKIYLDKYKSNHFFILEKSHLSCEAIIQKSIPLRIGDNGFEFFATH